MFRLHQKTSISKDYTNKKIVQTALEKLKSKTKNNIRDKYNIDIDVQLDKKRNSSATGYYKPPYMRIGIQNIYANMSHGQIRNQDFAKAVLSFKHENIHVFQNQKLFQQEHPDIFTRCMAVQKAIGIVIPEYYNKTYWENSLFEIHAEYQGISDTIEYFKTNFPEIDVEKELVNIINSEDYWYAKRPVTSLEDAYQKLDKQAEKCLTSNVQLYKSSLGLEQNSPAFQVFYQLTDMNAFNEKSADEQRDILLQFVAEYTPSIIRHYKALSDIPVADGPDKIPLDGELYRKNTDLPAKSTRADRVNNLEDKFGNVLAAEALEHDGSQYE